MFVKVQSSAFASAINISGFDIITVRRVHGGYALSVCPAPLDGPKCEDIANFPGEQQALAAFNSLMKAIENGDNYWEPG